MAEEQLVATFRPHKDVESDYYMLRDWCTENGFSFGSVLNSFLPAIAYAIQRQSFVNESDGERYVRADFGDILLRRTRHNYTENRSRTDIE